MNKNEPTQGQNIPAYEWQKSAPNSTSSVPQFSKT